MDHQTAPPASLPACPSCGTGAGQPRSVSIANRMRTVRYHCTECQHEWSVSAPDADGRSFLSS